MTGLTNATRRLLLAGGFALAVAAPIGAIAAYDGGTVLPAAASCPAPAMPFTMSASGGGRET